MTAVDGLLCTELDGASVCLDIFSFIITICKLLCGQAGRQSERGMRGMCAAGRVNVLFAVVVVGLVLVVGYPNRQFIDVVVDGLLMQ